MCLSQRISPQLALRTSPGRAAVSTWNSNARLISKLAVDFLTCAIAQPTCSYGRALWCFCSRLKAGKTLSSALPAGLSIRWPWVTAQSITASMRCLTRLAVSFLTVQMGSSIAKTSDDVISSTAFLPIRGKA